MKERPNHFSKLNTEQRLKRMGDLLTTVLEAIAEADQHADKLRENLGDPPEEWGDSWINYWRNLAHDTDGDNIWNQNVAEIQKRLQIRKSALAKLTKQEIAVLSNPNKPLDEHEKAKCIRCSCNNAR